MLVPNGPPNHVKSIFSNLVCAEIRGRPPSGHRPRNLARRAIAERERKQYAEDQSCHRIRIAEHLGFIVDRRRTADVVAETCDYTLRNRLGEVLENRRAFPKDEAPGLLAFGGKGT